ncbi:MAG: signal peptidase I [Actinomycetota bacterium]|nr:signal peptidase I [Actinomycetota bacterium]
MSLWLGLLALNQISRRVTGGSMRPALVPGDRIVVLPVRCHRLRRGDVIVVRDPRDTARETVKRVVGLPGEQVGMNGDRFEIAGVRYHEPYARNPHARRAEHQSVLWSVPPGHVVVLGDNRDRSTDSRAYGPVSEELVVGRVAARLCPPGRAPHCPPHPLVP